MEAYTVKVEESRPASGERPSAGPVYRCIYAKDGLLDPPSEIESPWEFFCGSVKLYPQNQMLGRREVNDGQVGQYVWQTYEEVYNKAIKIGSAIRGLGVNPGDRCGIYGVNCPEWVTAMEACVSQGICYVPLYDTLGATAVEFIINHAEISMVFVQENKIQSMLTCLLRCVAHLKTIVSFGKVADEQKQEAERIGVSCFSWEEFLLSGNVNCRLPQVCKDDTCTIMYTSGTTGDPKGVILTNRAVITQVINTEQLILETDKAVTEEDTYFSFLPLAHIFDQIIENYCIYKGASIGFWQGDVRYLMEDLQQLKPTLFCGVPRVFDRIYTGVKQKVSSGGVLSRKLFEIAYEHKLNNLKRGVRQDMASPFFDRLVFNKIKQVLGGRVRMMLSGAAPLPKHVEEFLRVTSCSVLIQGYGLTESCAGCFTSVANVFSMVGTVGIPVMTIEARLESVPDMGYDALSATARGEICLRGKTLFSGYYKRADLTDEVLVDGWFHTGDIGELQPDGAMKIIDRKKNIFKLSQGEYVAVENIESAYAQCSLITSIWVYGNSFESFLVGVAVPEKQALENWAAANDLTGNYVELCKHPKSRKYIMEELNNTGRRLQLRGFEMLKAIHLEPFLFDMERDLITPTFKLKRPQLLKYYKERIDELYQEAKEKKV
ncbi:long-chain acyl-CoA synthetase protein [Dioscorea alata]|uniref:Long-chain acyl-CoA synthetase protein n=2 Tax=Dioscorea alata TaxID=55571 RepID=A0ACB7UW27_DIOAL|nr:long-chain acyl-CoA synthetase protein [Dioscorea alata]